MKAGLLCGLLVASAVCAADTGVVADGVTRGFIHCRESKAMLALVERLLASDSAIEKTNDYFAYAVRGRVLGLPFSSLRIGVCDRSGERGCGWASYRVFAIDLPFAEARAQLKARYGVDFTVEKRDNEAEVTERPILAKAQGGKGALLYCDPGTL